MSLVQIPINCDDLFNDGNDRPVGGHTRQVRLLPTPMGNRPCLWISPYFVMQALDGVEEPCRVCVILLSKGPPKPDVVLITIPQKVIEKFPLVPVEW